MHGLINRSIQCFVVDMFGQDRWSIALRQVDPNIDGFEAMLPYEDAITDGVLDALADELSLPRDTLLEDLGAYLVAHPNSEALRRLLRFGGETFEEFLYSLEDLQERARLAVSDLELPTIEVSVHGPGEYRVLCRARYAGFGPVMSGMLRALADDYGALVLIEHLGSDEGAEEIAVALLDSSHAEGRQFDLVSDPG